LLQRYAGRSINRSVVTRYAKRYELLTPKMMRKVSWRILVRVMPREVARFIQSGFGELKISEARYEDLLSEADEHYPKYLENSNKSIPFTTQKHAGNAHQFIAQSRRGIPLHG
jgi:intergrase/recombinase